MFALMRGETELQSGDGRADRLWFGDGCGGLGGLLMSLVVLWWCSGGRPWVVCWDGFCVSRGEWKGGRDGEIFREVLFWLILLCDDRTDKRNPPEAMPVCPFSIKRDGGFLLIFFCRRKTENGL